MSASLEEHIMKEECSALRHREEGTARLDFDLEEEEEVEFSDDSGEEEDSEDSEEEEEEGDEERQWCSPLDLPKKVVMIVNWLFAT